MRRPRSRLTDDVLQASRVDCFPCIRMPPRIQLLEAPPTGSGLSFLARVIRKYYAPLLLKPLVKGIVLLTFGGMLVASVISVQHIKLGFGESCRCVIKAW